MNSTNTFDRLFSVQRLKNNRVNFKRTPLGTQFLFSCTATGDAIDMQPVPPDPINGITAYGLDTLCDFLHEVFNTSITDAMRNYVTRILNNFTALQTGDEKENLYLTAELVLHNWAQKFSEARKAFPMQPARALARLGAREVRWNELWGKLTVKRSFIKSVKLHHRSHVAGIMIPSELLEQMYWEKREPISIMEREDGSYYIRTVQDNEAQHLQRVQPITRDGIVHGNRYLYLTRHQKRALGIGPELYVDGVDLKFTHDFVDRHVIVVEPLTEKEAEHLPMLPRGVRADFFDEISVVKRHVSGPIILPTEFVRRYDVQKDDVLDTAVEGNKLIIYGRRSSCSVCGAEGDRGTMTVVPVCPDCADVIGDVRAGVQKNGSLAATVSEAKVEVAEALKKLEALEGRI